MPRTVMRWCIFLRAGKPGIDAGAQYHRATSADGWLSCPDNCAFDSKGRIWIATDGANTAAGVADGLYAADTEGPGRALPRLFYQAPVGAEVCGPLLTPDDRAILLAIQHPGEEATSTLRGAQHPLARLRRGCASAPIRGRHHADGWRADHLVPAKPLLSFAGTPLGAFSWRGALRWHGKAAPPRGWREGAAFRRD
jgi:secreted PhoX family phosphatase